MAGLTTNVGNQVVTIYPQQQLASTFGNSLLYGVLPNGGVSNVGFTVSGTSPSIVLTVTAGTTLYFVRQSYDPIDPSNQDTFLIKAILGPTGTGFPITSGSPNYSWGSDSKVYIIADIDYSTTTRFANIYGVNTLSGLNFTGVNNKVLLGTVLNGTTSDSANLHFSYEGQAGRDPLQRLYSVNDEFMLQFMGDGSGVYVSSGATFMGSTFLSPSQSLSYPSWTGTLYPSTGGLPYSSLIAPPAALTSYVADSNSGATINITGNEAMYNQVDFLRVKQSEVSHSTHIAWDSFLQPAYGFTPSSNPISGTQSALVNYLAQQYSTLINSSYVDPRVYNSVFNFPLKGDGITLMVMVRPRSLAPFNVIWPEYCIIYKNAGFNSATPAQVQERMKAPIYTGAQLGLT